MSGGLGQLPISETVLGCEVWLLGPWRGHGTLCATFVTAKSPSLLQNIVFSAAITRLRRGTEFKASLGSIARHCLKKKINK